MAAPDAFVTHVFSTPVIVGGVQLLEDPDELPTVTLRNVTGSGQVSMAVTPVSTGQYVAEAWIPGGWLVGEWCYPIVTYTHEGQEYEQTGDAFQLDASVSSRASETSVTALAGPVISADVRILRNNRVTYASAADIAEVIWYADLVAQTGATDPTLTITDAEGNVLLNAVALTEVGTSGVYIYTATGQENRLRSGTSYSAEVKATISGVEYTRTFVGISFE